MWNGSDLSIFHTWYRCQIHDLKKQVMERTACAFRPSMEAQSIRLLPTFPWIVTMNRRTRGSSLLFPNWTPYLPTNVNLFSAEWLDMYSGVVHILRCMGQKPQCFHISGIKGFLFPTPFSCFYLPSPYFNFLYEWHLSFVDISHHSMCPHQLQS